MIRSAKVYLLVVLSACLAFGQSGSPTKPNDTSTATKASAYYNFAMGHLYAELAANYNNKAEYVNKAIEFYRNALKEDPTVAFIFEELTDLYIQAGRLKDAVNDAGDMLKKDPKNLEARRILGRIYTRMIPDGQQGKIKEDMLRNAIEQYQKITEAAPKDVEAWLSLGRLYRAGGNSLEAEKAYNKSLEVEPNNDEAMTGLALIYSDLGENKKAAELLAVVTSKNPNPRTLAALAREYEVLRDYKSAADVLRKALDLHPEDDRLRRALAQNLMFAEQFDEALKVYEDVARQDPSDPQTQLRLAEIYRQKRDLAGARKALNKARELDKDSLEVRYEDVNLLDAEGKTDQAITALKSVLDATAKTKYNEAETQNRMMLLERMSGLYRGANQTTQAVETLRQIAALEPKMAPRVAAQIVDTYRSGKDFTKAKAEADAALKQYPNERSVKVIHAQVLSDIGKIDEAAAEVKPLLGGDKDFQTYIALAQIYEKGKRFTEMEKVLKDAEPTAKNPQDKQTIAFMRGAMYERAKKFDAAEAEFRGVLKEDPNNASALNYLGYMLADRGVRLDEAHQFISKALELDPDNGAYLDSLGWVLFRQNRLEQAETTLMRALEKVGNDPTVHDHLGDVYAKQGKTKDAITQWQASLKEWQTSAPSEQDPEEVAKVSRKLENARVKLAREKH